MRTSAPAVAGPTSATSRLRRATAIGAAAATVVGASMLAAAPAMAAKGGTGSGGKGGGKTTPVSSLTLVLLESTDGQAHHGQNVTFDVATDGTDRPYVSVTCQQDSTVVYSSVTGYFADYPWPYTNVFTLSSGAWAGGAAQCSAELYWHDGRKTVTGAVLDFPVLD